MKLIEIKNNFAKLYYLPAEEELNIGDFLTINDGSKKLAAQVVTIESTSKEDTNCAVVKFSFNLNENCSASAYTGYVPALDSKICKTDANVIKNIFSKKEKSEILGDFASYPELDFCVDSSFANSFTCVQSDRIENTKYVLNKLANAAQHGLIVDFDGTLEVENAFVFELGKNFKLPISVETLNYIYENDLIGLTVEQKTIIQDIVLEIQEYIESEDSGYIPFNTLLSVVEEIYKEDKSVSIILFRNKLLKYGQMKLFASEDAEIEALFETVEKRNLVILNLENVPPNWKKEALNFVTGHTNGELRLFMNLEDESVDKKLLMNLYKKPNIKPVISSAYSSKYATTLKSLARNILLFAPQEEQKSYPTYTSFLSLLRDDDFVLSGEQTFYTPLILTPHVPKIPVEEAVEEEIIEQPEIVDELPAALEDETDVSDIKTIFEESVEDEIAKDVDSMFYASPKEENPAPVEALSPQEEELPVLDEPEPLGEPEPLHEELTQEELPVSEVEEAESDTFTELEEAPEAHEEPEADDLFSESDLDILDELDDDEEDEDGETIELDLGADEAQSDDSAEIFDIEQLPHLEDSADNIETHDAEPEEADISIDELSELDTLSDEEPAEPSGFDDDELEPLISDDDEPSEPEYEEPVEEQKPQAPNIPVYTTGMDENLRPDETIKVAEGNIVYHQKYGRGVVEQIITYGKKTLCSIQFDNVGRRLLDPNLADLKQA
ncbi:TPA: hypothetical protein IAD52_06980 [Candidatus Spyradomonas excrementavium]|nr:hypothetical protein [Candidatus Spyradomonas excrementavium]